jgi:uncharacterized protein
VSAASTDQPIEVMDAPERQRFEAVRDGELLGFAAYQRADQLVVLTHTEVDPAHEGQGVGSALVRAALDQARAAGVRVLPLCPFVQTWMASHSDYLDLDYRRPASNVTD